MKISVVILNWNRAEDTIQAIESVLAQDYADFEVLVWDNASTDNSKTVLENKFGDKSPVTLIFADDNYGVAGGRNRAFRKTNGDLILSLDNDAVFESNNALSLIARRMNNATDIGAISFEVKRPDGHLMWPFSRSASEWRQREFETIRVDGCAFAVRRDAFEQAGGFAEHFSPYGAEDQHFAFKLIGLGYKILYFPDVVVIHAFNMEGRNRLQFMMHVRNSLWIPMELFPFPANLLGTCKQAYWLWHEACEQSRHAEFRKGLFEAIKGFRSSTRHVMPYAQWRVLRCLIRQDKIERATERRSGSKLGRVRR